MVFYVYVLATVVAVVIEHNGLFAATVGYVESYLNHGACCVPVSNCALVLLKRIISFFCCGLLTGGLLPSLLSISFTLDSVLQPSSDLEAGDKK